MAGRFDAGSIRTGSASFIHRSAGSFVRFKLAIEGLGTRENVRGNRKFSSQQSLPIRFSNEIKILIRPLRRRYVYVVVVESGKPAASK
jgi:hypothetical protein